LGSPDGDPIPLRVLAHPHARIPACGAQPDEEFRWSVPVIYYTYDPSFVDYFGTRGMAEVDAAVAILNRLTNVSSYSQGLTEFPLNEFRETPPRQPELFDLKSAALEMLFHTARVD